MKLTFYGVRGSIPTPSSDTVIYGGNTSCVYVESEEGRGIVLDAGTGIVNLGRELVNKQNEHVILLTHNHWDHIQGFPYFMPIFQEQHSVTIVPGNIDSKEFDAVLTQMSGSTFPVKSEQLPASINLQSDLSIKDKFSLNGFKVNTQALNHPDGGSAYCLYADGQKIAYVTDNELVPPTQPATSLKQWQQFVYQADVLIHDAQYIDDDLPFKHGWGHSTVKQVVELAIYAGVKQLFFISHEPCRSDAQISAIEKDLQAEFGEQIDLAFAREGMSIDLSNE